MTLQNEKPCKRVTPAFQNTAIILIYISLFLNCLYKLVDDTGVFSQDVCRLFQLSRIGMAPPNLVIQHVADLIRLVYKVKQGKKQPKESISCFW